MIKAIRRKCYQRHNRKNKKSAPKSALSDQQQQQQQQISPHSSSSLLLSLPFECRIGIFNYLDPQELVNASETCKKLSKDCRHGSLEQKILPTYQVGPRKAKVLSMIPFQSVTALLKRLRKNQTQNTKKFSQYSHLRVHKIEEFCGNGVHSISVNNKKIKTPCSRFRSLDVSIPSNQPTKAVDRYVVADLLCYLPNLVEINLSNLFLVGIGDGPFSSLQSRRKLEMVIWNRTSNRTIEGSEFFNCKNLKHVELDDTNFVSCWMYRGRLRRLSDLSNDVVATIMTDDENQGRGDDNNNDAGNEEEFNDNVEEIDDANDGNTGNIGATILEMDGAADTIFCYLRSVEYLSIRNAMWREPGSRPGTEIPVSQDALIKFVRNAPKSLRVFRSDLYERNVRMLRLERPNIEFL